MVRFLRLFAAMVALSGIACRLGAQAPDTVVLMKLQSYVQLTASDRDQNGTLFAVVVDFPVRTAATVELQRAGAPAVGLVQDTDGSYSYAATYNTMAELNAQFPDGAYTITVSSGGQRTSTTVNLSTTGTVSPVLITNFDELQQLQTAQPTVRWTRIPDAKYGDVLTFQVFREDRDDPVLEKTLVSAAYTQAEVAPDSLPVAIPLLGNLTYLKVTANTTTNSGATQVICGLGFALQFAMYSSGPAATVADVEDQMVSLGYTLYVSPYVVSWSPATYQWYRNDEPVRGATARELSIPDVGAADAGAYHLEVRNAAGVTKGPPLTVAIGPRAVVDATSVVPAAADASRFVRDASGTIYYVTGRSAKVGRVAPDGTVTLIVGHAGNHGWRDGPAEQAVFSDTSGIALGLRGELYVSDNYVGTIRRIDPDGMVTTIAGKPFADGLVDGPALGATFTSPGPLALDASGNLYIADYGGAAIRKLSPDGMVSTVTRNFRPTEIALHPSGALIVAAEDTVRRIAPDGTTTVLAGGTAWYTKYGAGVNVSISRAESIGVDASGVVHYYDSAEIRRIEPNGWVSSFPVFAAQATGRPTRAMSERFHTMIPEPDGTFLVSGLRRLRFETASTDPGVTASAGTGSHTMAVGSTLVLSGTVSGPAAAMSWVRDGIAIAGATTTTLILSHLRESDAGDYRLVAGNMIGSASSAPIPIAVSTTSDTGRISNLAVRSSAGSGSKTLIMGFVVGGPEGVGKQLLLRGVGPTLKVLGVSGVLVDPVLTLFRGQDSVNANDNWSPEIEPAFDSVGAFKLGAGSLDAATTLSLTPAAYTMQITGRSGSGVALAEAYDLDGGTAVRLKNVSARTHVSGGENLLIGGFVIAGGTSKTVLIRAVGPGLNALGVPWGECLPNPQLSLYRGTTVLAGNKDWGLTTQLQDVFQSVGAFLPYAWDAALVVTLKPGPYTVQVTDEAERSGIALLEVYELP